MCTIITDGGQLQLVLVIVFKQISFSDQNILWKEQKI